MAKLKVSEIKNMSKEDRMKKLKELKFELLKSQAGKKGNVKIKEIKKMIARIHSIDK